MRAFAPLDGDERINAAPLPEDRRGLQLFRVNVDRRRLNRRELAAMLVLPALFFLLAILGHAKASTGVAVGAVFLLLVGLVVFALTARPK